MRAHCVAVPVGPKNFSGENPTYGYAGSQVVSPCERAQCGLSDMAPLAISANVLYAI